MVTKFKYCYDKKASYSDQKGIFVTKLDGMYLAMQQDAVKDRAVLVADSDIGIVYDYFSSEIEKKIQISNLN